MNYLSEKIRIKKLNTQLPSLWYLAWSAIGALALWFLVPRFGLVQLSASSILIAAMLLFLQSPSHIRLRIAIGSCILPFDAIIPSIPYIARLRGSTSAIIAIALCLGAIGIGARYTNRKTHLSGWTLITAALVVPILATGWPESFRGVILMVAMLFVIPTAAKLTDIKSLSNHQYAETVAIAVGLYAILTFVFKNPVGLIRSISETSFVSQVDAADPNRFLGFAGDYEILGLLLTIGATAAYFLILTLKSWKRYFYLLLAAFIGVSLIATGSLFAILTTSLSVVWLTLRSLRIRKTKSFVTIPLIALGILPLMPIVYNVVSARTYSRRIDGSLNVIELVNRQEVWQFILASPNWSKTSFFGLGWPYPLGEIGRLPHSTFLTFWIIGGVIGLIMFSVLWTSLVIKMIKLVLRHDQLISLHASILLLACLHTDITRLSSTVLLFTIVMSLVLNVERSRKLGPASN
jgi:hypothetical protein